MSYSVLLLEKLKERFPRHHMQFMYDIACTLKKHLMLYFVCILCLKHAQNAGVT